jgi:hypothetical protein
MTELWSNTLVFKFVNKQCVVESRFVEPLDPVIEDVSRASAKKALYTCVTCYSKPQRPEILWISAQIF